MELTDEVRKNRSSDHDILPLFLNRWSPRAMSGESIDEEELMQLFEAARWAPSSYNEQPWRFIYAVRDSEHWERLFNLMVEFNQSWAKNAAVLIVIVSSKKFEQNGNPNKVHSFDCGSAWENLALQAASMGLVAHGMAGFDDEKARADLGVPDDFDVEAMVAIGRRASPETLPEQMREQETPNSRRPVEETIMEGKFRN